ncbi:autotransporter assembly complex protein TamA [Seohaeicola saemankumensis]|uniref:autotransporter assembly complex protein TamA n=1 Tax=Seohaeicola saemankumensis TaxID=481181 RepID=UPI001E55D4E0|nr:BamA/TamA family outer membrane protein [Seohaeicola saemankumensis]
MSLTRRIKGPVVMALSAHIVLGIAALPATALDRLDISLDNSDSESLQERLTAGSLLAAAERDEVTDPQDLLAAAQADYRRMVDLLYASGYYSGTVSIRVDGREAAEIPPLDPPASISVAEIRVNPGRRFTFGQTEIGPLAPGTTTPEDFRRGAIARATVISDTSTTVVNDWRAAGYAKVEVTDQRVTAIHPEARLDAQIAVTPGPAVTFGATKVKEGSSVRPTAIRRIAGLPEGEAYDSDEVAKAAQRLRRTGAFRSVALTEAELLGPGDTLDIGIAVVDERPRRFGFGAEIATDTGLGLNSFWMHRNFLGGAERFRVEGNISGIGAQTGGLDYGLSARFERPAVYGPDTGFFAVVGVERLDEEFFLTERAYVGLGATRTFSDTLLGELGITLEQSRVTSQFSMREVGGRPRTREFTLVTLPGALTWDRRDDLLNPTEGFYLKAEAMPFIDTDGDDSGGRLRFDARAYQAFGQNDGVVLAGRAQIGALFGPDALDTPPDFLFYSGGGGTVRGQPYQSLFVDLGGGRGIGGRSFFGFSGEVRAKVSEKFSVVGFADAGYIGQESFYDGTGEWHSGAGLGLRYDTTVGPLRLDVAGPVGGSTGDGVQVYIGIGQAF